MQTCFPGLKPPLPTLRSERVAEAIARRLVEEVNLDDFYWTAEELPERIEDVKREIMRCGRPASVFRRLYRQQPPINCRGDRSGDPYGWEGIDEHCQAIAVDIAYDELAKAIEAYHREYGPAGQNK